MENDSVHKKLYDYMLESGELKQVHPRLTGVWEKDEKSFIAAQEEFNKILGLDVK